MGLLGINVAKGRTFKAILRDEFPPLDQDGDKVFRLVSFRTMAYVQASIMLAATFQVPCLYFTYAIFIHGLYLSMAFTRFPRRGCWSELDHFKNPSNIPSSRIIRPPTEAYIPCSSRTRSCTTAGCTTTCCRPWAYDEDVRVIVGASGRVSQRVLKHRRSLKPPPAA